MSDFEKWWADNSATTDRGIKCDCEAAYLAGQSSAEQRVKELEAESDKWRSKWNAQVAKCAELENDNRALHDQFLYLTKEEIPKLQAKCAELERERDDALKALDENWVQHQRVVKAEKELAELKAQAGEQYPVAWMIKDTREPINRYKAMAHQAEYGIDSLIPLYERATTSTPAAEPVAWMNDVGGLCTATHKLMGNPIHTRQYVTPLYDHPAAERRVLDYDDIPEELMDAMCDAFEAADCPGDRGRGNLERKVLAALQVYLNAALKPSAPITVP